MTSREGDTALTGQSTSTPCGAEQGRVLPRGSVGNTPARVGGGAGASAPPSASHSPDPPTCRDRVCTAE